MKKIYFILLLIILFLVPYVFAQMGGSKSGGMMGGQQSGMMGGHGHTKGMLHGHEVEGDIVHHMGQMSRLMQQMRGMISDKSDAESMRKLSGIMQDMSEHFKKMSVIMKKGNATQKEMQELDQHNRMMQESYEMMRW